MRKIGFQWFLFIGAFAGAGLTSWLAPKVIAWYFDPPVDIGVNCRSATEWSMYNLMKLQIAGLGAGVLIAVILYFLLSRKKSS